MRVSLVWSVILSLSTGSLPALADNALQGRVQIDSSGQPLRISRKGDPRLKRQTTSVDPGAYSAAQGPRSRGLEQLQSSFSEGPRNAGQSRPPVLDPLQEPEAPLLSGRDSRNQRVRGTHVWQLSTQGGYYDVTQQVKRVVPGYDLWRYGGTFANGYPVAPGPVSVNGAKHTRNYRWAD